MDEVFDFGGRDWPQRSSLVFYAAPSPKGGEKIQADRREERLREACVDAAASSDAKAIVETCSERNAPPGELIEVTDWISDLFVERVDGLILSLTRRSTGCGIALTWARGLAIPTLVLIRDGEAPTGLLPDNVRSEWETVRSVRTLAQAEDAVRLWIEDNLAAIVVGPERRQRRLSDVAASRTACALRWQQLSQPQRGEIASRLALPLDQVEEMILHPSRAALAFSGDLLGLTRELGVATPRPELSPQERLALQQAAEMFHEVRDNLIDVYEAGIDALRYDAPTPSALTLQFHRNAGSGLTNPHTWRRIAVDLARNDARDDSTAN